MKIHSHDICFLFFSSYFQNLPECLHDNSVCGYVELNQMGISVQSICRCKDFIPCPDSFDRHDGQTIIHGLSQYKVGKFHTNYSK